MIFSLDLNVAEAAANGWPIGSCLSLYNVLSAAEGKWLIAESWLNDFQNRSRVRHSFHKNRLEKGVI
ncbi:hypothetical protein [Anoxybacteroides rupiense]|uniref:hypothetical protein n=1 Tax=Anoxybacteroides rupiense TaxID=311460 RepID=UPI001606AAE0|nr:hypothetical protein [Anoxybacillus rupiensis]MBB3906449.1 hypothetical protein [Anoxybacillus rupiensis]